MPCIGEELHIEIWFQQFFNGGDICSFVRKLLELHCNVLEFFSSGDKVVFFVKIQSSQDLRFGLMCIIAYIV